MKSMENIAEMTKREIFFQIRSKSYLCMSALLILIVLLHMYSLYHAVLKNYQVYTRTKQMYIDGGMDITEELEKDNVVYEDQNSRISNNPIKEDYTNLAVSIQNIEPLNVVSNTYEYFLFVFGTLIFGIYSAYVAAYDFKFKTYKVISASYSQNEIIIGKICSLFFFQFLSMVCMAVMAWGLSFPVKYLVSGKIPINEYSIPMLGHAGHIVLQFIFVMATLILYTIIGFSIGYIAKNMLPVTFLLFLYTLLIPSLGAYDLKNIVSYFAHKIFDFQSQFVIFDPVSISAFWGIVVLVSIATLLLLSVKVISLKRSRYD